MQKLLLLSVLLIGAFVGTFFGWTQLGSVQATLNQSGPVQSGSVQCITAPCNYQSPSPLSSSPNLDGNDNTITAQNSEIETPDESQNSNDKNEPCLSPCPPGTEICIQMCKPTGQQGLVNEEPQSDSQQEFNFSHHTDEDTSHTTSGGSTTNDEVGRTDLEQSDSD